MTFPPKLMIFIKVVTVLDKRHIKFLQCIIKYQGGKADKLDNNIYIVMAFLVEKEG